LKKLCFSSVNSTNIVLREKPPHFQYHKFETKTPELKPPDMHNCVIPALLTPNTCIGSLPRFHLYTHSPTLIVKQHNQLQFICPSGWASYGYKTRVEAKMNTTYPTPSQSGSEVSRSKIT
jgi:hypothetical protein